MKFIAAMTVDLERSPIGTRSRLTEELHGVPLLRRTIQRLRRASRLASIRLIAPPDQVDRTGALVSGLDAGIVPCSVVPPYAALVRAGRVWGLDGWRGGIGGMCAFDEDVNVAAVAALAGRERADAIVCVPAAAPLVDPGMIDAMIAHHEAEAAAAPLTIVQAPPGLGAAVFRADLLAELAPTGQPLGALLAYRPEQPGADLTGKEACYRPNAAVIEARGRLICDTRRSFERVRALMDDGADDWDAVRIARRLTERESIHVDDAPEEIEIELITDEPRPDDSILRPGGGMTGRRGPISREAITAVIEAIAGYDDVRIVLGGFGDPCGHPEFGAICRTLRDSSAAAIAVRTPARLDDPAIEAALFDTPVDVVEVTLDATTAETYRRVHGIDEFDAVTQRLDRWLARRMAGATVLPLIVPSFVKSRETLHELEPFFDQWTGRIGMALVTGHCHRAGQVPPRAVTSMAPPQRVPCCRTFSRAMILADGRMTTCDQDFAGRQTLGRIPERVVSELWRSETLAAIRETADPKTPLCPACDEWHRA